MSFPIKLSQQPDVRIRLEKDRVHVIDPDSTWISPLVRIYRETVIYPNTYVVSNNSSSFIGGNCHIGPNAYLREWFGIKDGVKIGFGAEVVRSIIGNGTKAAHFCHISDATIGHDCNIAAGVIFCNFDGKCKNGTIVEDDVFIGASAMIVPSSKTTLKIGKGCYIGAGSVISKDIPPGALVVETNHIVEYKKVIKENGIWKFIRHSSLLHR